MKPKNKAQVKAMVGLHHGLKTVGPGGRRFLKKKVARAARRGVPYRLVIDGGI